ncbi:hypothetical protein [Colwellia sp. PAMC 21821]|uniref:hypothetical protein n=1 Tax=Colwellia sp. PAMC 21821 TaxID=1816219 RepID=UPI0009BCA93B|nr:hypothetical protein [Colwellia sp. PAMC 21821]ARD46272.1 hypothetical protein A3Q33_19505 [Colwellia sp. PAMC 21821]
MQKTDYTAMLFGLTRVHQLKLLRNVDKFGLLPLNKVKHTNYGNVLPVIGALEITFSCTAI